MTTWNIWPKQMTAVVPNIHANLLHILLFLRHVRHNTCNMLRRIGFTNYWYMTNDYCPVTVMISHTNNHILVEREAIHKYRHDIIMKHTQGNNRNKPFNSIPINSALMWWTAVYKSLPPSYIHSWPSCSTSYCARKSALVLQPAVLQN
jgi:hypothetical protein